MAFSDELKPEHIQAVLSDLGIHTNGNGSKDGWHTIHSPLREDDNPSFGINTFTGAWTDHGINERGDIVNLVERIVGCTTSEAIQHIRKINKIAPPGPQAVTDQNHNYQKIASYTYKDEVENPNLVVERLREKESGRKSFRQRKPNGDSVKGSKRILYKLPDIIKAAENSDAPILFVEGEKDVDNLWNIGISATTTPQGAGSFQACLKSNEDLLNPLQNQQVVIIPDNDTEGRSYASQVAQNLQSLAASVKVLHLENLPEHGDVSDWMDEVGLPDEDLKAKLLSKTETTPEWSPVDSLENDEGSLGIKVSALGDILRDNSTPPKYLIEHILPEKSEAIIVAREKTGKTILGANLGLSLAAGRDWFNFRIPEPVRVLNIQAEVAYYAMRERLKTMQAHFQDVPDSQYYVTHPFTCDIREDAHFEELLQFIGLVDPQVIIVDPLIAFHGADENSNTEMQQVMNRFRELTAYGHAIILVHHSRKYVDGSVGDNSRGASSTVGAVDSIVEMTKQKDGAVKLGFSLRYGETPSDLTLRLNPSTLWFKRAKSSDLDNAKHEIIQSLKEFKEFGAAKTEIRDKLTQNGMSERLVYRKIKELTEDGIITDNGKERYARIWLTKFSPAK